MSASVISWSMVAVSLLAALAEPAPANSLPEGAVARLGTLSFRTGGEVKALTFSPDGKTLAVAAEDGLIRLWEPRSGKELRRLSGHGRGVRSLAFSPDGKLLASGGYDQTVRIWEPATGKLRHVGGANHAVALALSFSPDGKILATAHRNRVVCLWSVESGKEIRQLAGHTNWVTSVAFSADGKTLASGSRDRTIRLWNPASGEETKRIETSQSVNGVFFSSEGNLNSAASDGTIRVWDPATGNERQSIEAHQTSIYNLAPSADGKHFASAGGDGTVRLWETATLKGKLLAASPGEIFLALAVSGDGLVASAMAGRHAVRVHDTAAGKELTAAEDRGHDARITALAFAPDGKLLASAGSDRQLRLWEPASGKLLHAGTTSEPPVCQLLFSPDGRTLASAGTDRTIVLWETASGKEQRRFKGETSWDLVRLSFSPQGGVQAWGSTTTTAPGQGRLMLSSAGTLHEVCLVHLPGEVIQQPFRLDPRWLETNFNTLTMPPGVGRLHWPFHSAPITAVEVSTSRAYLASGSGDTTVCVWRISSGKLMGKLVGHEDRVSFVAFSADDRLIITGSDDGSVRLWETATRSEAGRLGGEVKNRRLLALSPDGRLLAWAGGGELHLWDVTTGAEWRVLAGHWQLITALAFSPDGKLLASGSSDTSILLWNVGGERTLPAKPDLSTEQLDGLWAALASDKAAGAYPAMWQLRRSPQAAVAYLKSQMKAWPGSPMKSIAELIRELDHEKFAVRSEAQVLLEQYGELAEAELLKALERRPGLEVVRRIEQLLAALEQNRATGLASPQDLRPIRAIQVLEWIDHSGSRELLEKIAQGSPLVRQTQEAKAALARLQGAKAR